MDNREIRLSTRPVEVREDGDNGPVIVGYAAVFDQWSEDLGGFVERVRPGAFAGALQGDVRALWNHDRNMVLGRTVAGTLTLTEDEIGLRYEIQPPDSTWGRDAVVAIRRGDVSQSSFGFQTLRDEWRQAGSDRVERDLLEVNLFDVSPVTFPAYPQATVSVRAQADAIREQGSGAGSRDGGDARNSRARIEALRRQIDLEANS